MQWTDVLSFVIKALILASALGGLGLYSSLFERKLVGRFQNRYGPNRVGPGGYLQPIADAVKLLFKESIKPTEAKNPVYNLAPILALTIAMCAFAVIPLGPDNLNIFGAKFFIADVNIGILYILAVSSLGVYAITLAGWSSGNKYSLLGAIRASAQIISYELALGLSLLSVIVLSSSLRMQDIVQAQHTIWFIIPAFISFVVYCTAAVAETNRAPFDLAEAEQELVAGYLTEYSGMSWALFFAAEYINMITVASIATTMFLGGYQPLIDLGLGWDWAAPIWFALKVSLLMFGFVWLRATLPRLKYNRLMHFGWKVLIPLAMVNLIIISVIVAVVS
ncbi:MAG: NADH-quinone oxidoreductase subunit [Chloroflexi bacterium]|jgi:NADH-quinone oxidoreductase subunit H|nr:NADH-quinone oxidoreductase subunit [Chloroflexota bacterium]